MIPGEVAQKKTCASMWLFWHMIAGQSHMRFFGVCFREAYMNYVWDSPFPHLDFCMKVIEKHVA